jgi:hypothetical protein
MRPHSQPAMPIELVLGLITVVGICSSAAITGLFGVRQTRIARDVEALQEDERKCKSILRDVVTWAKDAGYVPSQRLEYEIGELLEPR